MVTESICLFKLFGRPDGYIRVKATKVLRRVLVGTEKVASSVVCLL